MSQFDQTTERKAKAHEQWCQDYPDVDPAQLARLVESHNMGRNSAKESLEILARVIRDMPCGCIPSFCRGNPDYNNPAAKCGICVAIERVKARGDWPLGEV